MISLLLAALIAQAPAEPPFKAVDITQGEPAPFTGTLLTRRDATVMAKELVDLRAENAEFRRGTPEPPKWIVVVGAFAAGAAAAVIVATQVK